MANKNQRARQQSEMYDRFKQKIKKVDKRNKIGRYTPPKPRNVPRTP